MSFTTSLWGEALRTFAYILNRVPSKLVPKNPFELWTARRPSLNHFQVRGYPAKVEIYIPRAKKTNRRLTSSYFVGYIEKFNGYSFIALTEELKLLNHLKEITVGVQKLGV